MRIGFCTMEAFDNRQKGSVGSSMIRARWLINHWPEAEEYKIGEKYDVLIFQKVYWKEMIKNFEGIKILDLCDPDWLEGKPVMEYVELCDATVTSTQALTDYIKQYQPNKEVICIPDRVDLDVYTKKKTEHAETLKNLVWYGYHTGFHYVQNALEILKEKGIRLTVISDQPMAIPMGMGTARDIVDNVQYNQETIAEELVKYDASLLPDPSSIDLRGKFKSNNKLTQCWALGLPVVRTPDDIDRLMSREAREKEASFMREKVESEYDIKQSVKEYQDLIGKIKNNG